MRILQLIDSLDAGGAERMAVNYANVLAKEIEFSGLVATRKEGLLLNQIHSSVSYLFLKKRMRLDIGATLRLRSYILKNRVTHIHAHSTSFFLAVLIKLILPSLKIIRHDHYGNNEFLAARPYFMLKLTVSFFNGIIAVNQNLKKWSEVVLKAKNVIYFPNFPSTDLNLQVSTILKGQENKKIVSLANLRPQKNLFLLIEIAQKLKQSHSDWSFHLVGKDFDDDYSKQIKENIKKYELEHNVFLYGSKEDVLNILKQADIAILTSISEGLPVALLEYGLCKKAVVATEVGDIPFIIEHNRNGMLVPNLNADAFYNLLVEFIENEKLREILGNRLFETVCENFSEKVVIKKYLNWLQTS